MNQRNAQKYKPSLHDFSVVDKYMKTVCITLNTISAVYGLLTFVLTHGTRIHTNRHESRPLKAAV